jgi:hypothetical protein
VSHLPRIYNGDIRNTKYQFFTEGWVKALRFRMGLTFSN